MMRSMFCQAMAVLVVEEPSVILIVSRFLLAKQWFYCWGGCFGAAAPPHGPDLWEWCY